MVETLAEPDQNPLQDLYYLVFRIWM
jgi:hypothetical protein